MVACNWAEVSGAGVQPLFTLMGLFAPLRAKRTGSIRRQQPEFTRAGFRFSFFFSPSRFGNYSCSVIRGRDFKTKVTTTGWHHEFGEQRSLWL